MRSELGDIPVPKMLVILGQTTDSTMTQSRSPQKVFEKTFSYQYLYFKCLAFRTMRSHDLFVLHAFVTNIFNKVSRYVC